MNLLTNGANWELPSKPRGPKRIVHVSQLELRHLAGMMTVATKAFPQDYRRCGTCTKEWLRVYLMSQPVFFSVGAFYQGKVVAYLVW